MLKLIKNVAAALTGMGLMGLALLGMASPVPDLLTASMCLATASIGFGMLTGALFNKPGTGAVTGMTIGFVGAFGLYFNTFPFNAIPGLHAYLTPP